MKYYESMKVQVERKQETVVCNNDYTIATREEEARKMVQFKLLLIPTLPFLDTNNNLVLSRCSIFKLKLLFVENGQGLNDVPLNIISIMLGFDS